MKVSSVYSTHENSITHLRQLNKDHYKLDQGLSYTRQHGEQQTISATNGRRSSRNHYWASLQWIGIAPIHGNGVNAKLLGIRPVIYHVE
jgi:hypothetical protein